MSGEPDCEFDGEVCEAFAALVAERDALKAEVAKLTMDGIAAKPLYSRRKLEAERDALRKALEPLLYHYVTLISSGDCGFWEVEKEPAVIAARAALSEHQQREEG